MKTTELLREITKLNEEQLRLLENYIQELLRLPNTLSKYKKD